MFHCPKGSTCLYSFRTFSSCHMCTEMPLALDAIVLLKSMSFQCCATPVPRNNTHEKSSWRNKPWHFNTFAWTFFPSFLSPWKQLRIIAAKPSLQKTFNNWLLWPANPWKKKRKRNKTSRFAWVVAPFNLNKTILHHFSNHKPWNSKPYWITSFFPVNA